MPLSRRALLHRMSAAAAGIALGVRSTGEAQAGASIPSVLFDVTVYGARGDGASDDTAAFRAMHKAMCRAQREDDRARATDPARPPIHFLIRLPPRNFRYSWNRWTWGLRRFTLSGYGASIQCMHGGPYDVDQAPLIGNREHYWTWPAEGPSYATREDYGLLIAEARPADMTVTVLPPASMRGFVPGAWVLIQSYAQQMDGYPPNMRYADRAQIVAIDKSNSSSRQTPDPSAQGQLAGKPVAARLHRPGPGRHDRSSRLSFLSAAGICRADRALEPQSRAKGSGGEAHPRDVFYLRGVAGFREGLFPDRAGRHPGGERVRGTLFDRLHRARQDRRRPVICRLLHRHADGVYRNRPAHPYRMHAAVARPHVRPRRLCRTMHLPWRDGGGRLCQWHCHRRTQPDATPIHSPIPFCRAQRSDRPAAGRTYLDTYPHRRKYRAHRR